VGVWLPWAGGLCCCDTVLLGWRVRVCRSLKFLLVFRYGSSWTRGGTVRRRSQLLKLGSDVAAPEFTGKSFPLGSWFVRPAASTHHTRHCEPDP